MTIVKFRNVFIFPTFMAGYCLYFKLHMGGMAIIFQHLGFIRIYYYYYF